MMRRTSKRLKEVVDKMCLPAVVRMGRIFWHDAHNVTEKSKHPFVLMQLTLMTVCCHTMVWKDKMQRGLHK